MFIEIYHELSKLTEESFDVCYKLYVCDNDRERLYPKVASMLCYVAEIVPKSTLFKVTYNGGLWESRTWEHSVPVLVRIPVLAACNLIPV